MLKNLLKTAFRNIWKNKVFSLINIVGLSIGLSASFVIGIIIFYDLTFDKFHPNSDRIYRVVSTFTSPDGTYKNRGTAIPLGQTIREGMAGIDRAVTFYSANFLKITQESGNLVFKNTSDIIYTDASYFAVFKYHWIAGNRNNILENPNEVVLTSSRATKYFPGQTPDEVVGKILAYNDSIQVKVVGVVDNFKDRTDIDFQEFLSYKTANSAGLKDRVLVGDWNSTNSASQLFILVHDTGALPQIQQNLDQLAKEHEDKDMVSKGYIRNFGLQPLSDMHFNQDLGTFNHNGRTANINVMLSLAFVALFILLLGCINFINLNTAQATKRAKEIGIRKTLGSSKKHLIYQFMGETALLTLGAAALSLLLAPLLIRFFSDFVPLGISAELFANRIVIVCMLLLLIGVTFVAGFYPAVVLSNFRPIKVLKNQISQGDGKPIVRKYLTVFQFTIAQIFIIATLFVGKQLNYMLKKDMGFKTTANAYIRAWDDDDYQKRLTFVEELKTIPQITEVSLGGDPPASGNINSAIATFTKGDKETNTELQFLYGDTKYRQLYGIGLLAGRDRLNDTIKEYVINETYSKLLGFSNPADAVGQFIKVGDSLRPIVGVMANFYQRSLSSDISPMALDGDTNIEFYHQFNTVHFSFGTQSSETWPAVIDRLKEIWKTIYPDVDFEVNFMDDTIAHFYDQERKTSVLLKWSMVLSILISCLGLLGLVIYTTERRTKEIGIRKVLGASLAQLNLLLCKEFLFLVGVAFAIAVPITWLGINNWLQDFANKTSLNWWVFFLSGIAMLVIALVIISIRTIAAANRNPVKSLRTE